MWEIKYFMNSQIFFQITIWSVKSVLNLTLSEQWMQCAEFGIGWQEHGQLSPPKFDSSGLVGTLIRSDPTVSDSSSSSSSHESNISQSGSRLSGYGIWKEKLFWVENGNKFNDIIAPTKDQCLLNNRSKRRYSQTHRSANVTKMHQSYIKGVMSGESEWRMNEFLSVLWLIVLYCNSDQLILSGPA